MAKDETVTVTFDFERDTKGTHVFKEVGADGSVKDRSNGLVTGSFYLQKSSVPKAPKRIEATLKYIY